MKKRITFIWAEILWVGRCVQASRRSLSLPWEESKDTMNQSHLSHTSSTGTTTNKQGNKTRGTHFFLNMAKPTHTTSTSRKLQMTGPMTISALVGSTPVRITHTHTHSIESVSAVIPGTTKPDGYYIRHLKTTTGDFGPIVGGNVVCLKHSKPIQCLLKRCRFKK